MQSVAIRDYWPSSQSSLGINCKDILALCNALKSFSSTVSKCWVDVFTDSQVLLRAWRRQGARSPSLIASLKRLFAVISDSNIHLNLYHILSASVMLLTLLLALFLCKIPNYRQVFGREFKVLLAGLRVTLLI